MLGADMRLLLCRRVPPHGFTLVELLIVVAIVGILASIAVPGYQDYVRRAQVQEAIASLADLRTRLEQYYQDNRSYADTSGNCGLSMPAGLDLRFAYSCVIGNSGQSYLLTATGAGLVRGLIYSVDQQGTRQTSCTACVWNFSLSQTWVTRRP
jgi:type IV pilus assembly protein PilE